LSTANGGSSMLNDFGERNEKNEKRKKEMKRRMILEVNLFHLQFLEEKRVSEREIY